MQSITLKAARINANLSRKTVAEKIGKSESTIKNWELGLFYPKQPDIEKLCALYGISYDYLKF